MPENDAGRPMDTVRDNLIHAIRLIMAKRAEYFHPSWSFRKEEVFPFVVMCHILDCYWKSGATINVDGWILITFRDVGKVFKEDESWGRDQVGALIDVDVFETKPYTWVKAGPLDLTFYQSIWLRPVPDEIAEVEVEQVRDTISVGSVPERP